MPEGPSILILKEATTQFIGKKVVKAVSDRNPEVKRLEGKKLLDIKIYGKNYFLCFSGFYVRIHLMLFGTYRVNEHKKVKPRLGMQFAKGELNFYTCVLEIKEGHPDDEYDYETDVLSDQWKPRKAEKKVKEMEHTKVCDALMDQAVFTGVGNIIKNEVLFRIKTQPETLTENMSAAQIKSLVKEARDYSFDFYRWKKAFQLNKNLLIYGKKICPRCKETVMVKDIGRNKRRCYFCTNCQHLFVKE